MRIYVNKPMPEYDLSGMKPYLPEKVLAKMKIYSIIINAVIIIAALLCMRLFPAVVGLDAFSQIKPEIDNRIISGVVSVFISLIFVIILLILHEILHVLPFISHDIYLYFNKTVLGIIPALDCDMTYFSWVIYRLLPFIILSVCTFILSLFLAEPVSGILRYTAFLNVLMSSFDLIFTVFTFRIPRTAVFRRGYYRV